MLLGAYAELRQVTISYVMYVFLSVRMGQLGSKCTDFHEILCLSIFRKYVDKKSSLIKI